MRETPAIDRGEFSLYWYDPEGGQYEELRYVDARTAVERAHGLMRSIGGRLGTVARIIITDGGDFCCFEWKHGKGVVFPAP